MPLFLLTFINTLRHFSIRKTQRYGLFFLIAFGAHTSFASGTDHLAELRQLVQLAEYISVDYPAAVKNGEIVNAGEHQEMIEFSGLILDKSLQLTEIADKNGPITDKAKALQVAIINKQPVEIIQTLAADLRASLLTLAPQASVPESLLSKRENQLLFQQSCAGCHGETGQGNGIQATGLEPPPTNFIDKIRASNRSVLGLYDAISHGIEGTAMTAFNQLTEKQKWSLAFYTGSLAFQSSSKSQQQAEPVISLQQLINYSPNILSKELPSDQRNQIETLRANPEQFFIQASDPISITRRQLEAALDAYHTGDYNKAHDLAVSAYLDGFEQVEVSLSAKSKDLKDELESLLISLRQKFSHSENNQELNQALTVTFQKLAQAESLLTTASLSSGELFSASLVILLREGLEALLVVIALTTVLLRTNRRDALRYLHLGWISALVAGAATWVAAQTLISISGTSREIMEGVGALLAATVLFYVGFWMHNKSHADHWQAYIQKQID
ncbi:MAG: FTR1 family protein, partial [Pseudomonadales bacterium]|nr:FTR1 family protein [Pseudomonadales bacterium]